MRAAARMLSHAGGNGFARAATARRTIGSTMTAAVTQFIPSQIGAVLPAIAAQAAAMLEQSMRRPSLMPLVLHSLHIVF
jgi:hypothetical protein